MQEGKIIHFRTVDELKLSLDKELEDLKKKSDEYSRIIGEKLRVEETANPADLAELKEKLEGPADPKKKKPVKKKDKNSNWHSLGDVSVYDGIGVKGELEHYFKSLEIIKSKIEKLQKAKNSIDDLISKGLKKDFGCAILISEPAFEIVFIKTGVPKAKFSFKSIFDVGVEKNYEIKI